ncbi:MAG: TrkH family potassium uptake protein [Eubacterium sp.]
MKIDKSNIINKRKNYDSKYPRIVCAGFITIILLGTALLMLPISAKTPGISFTDALFTATSATCVTGLVVFDTFTKWTLFGQIVILCLIQIGGLGFITIFFTFTQFLKKRVSLKEKMLFKENIGSIYTGNMKKLVRKVIAGTAIFEILGALILCTQFIPKMGFKNGLYTSVFLSVSAFCNAGFDVMGRKLPGSSLMTVNNNPVILLTIALLIIIGGIGFIVWDDITIKKFRFKQYSLHSKLTLVTTGILLIASTAAYLIFEYDNTFKDMGFGQSLLNAFFTGVTPRTAGFNSVDTSELCGASKMITYVLMFIGGSSGSTAGGIKTTTVAVLFLCVMATTKNKRSIEAFGKRVDEDALRKTTALLFINLSEIFLSSLIISAIQKELSFSDILFECISALGTVGMTTGITPHLQLIPKLIIILLMFVGRLTSLVFALMFVIEKNNTSTQKPKGLVLIG